MVYVSSSLTSNIQIYSLLLLSMVQGPAPCLLCHLVLSAWPWTGSSLADENLLCWTVSNTLNSSCSINFNNSVVIILFDGAVHRFIVHRKMSTIRAFMSGSSHPTWGDGAVAWPWDVPAATTLIDSYRRFLPFKANVYWMTAWQRIWCFSDFWVAMGISWNQLNGWCFTSVL